MRLTRKFIIALAIATLVVLGTNAVVRVRREASFFDEDMRRDTIVAGQVLASAVTKTWQLDGEPAAQALVSRPDLHGHLLHAQWIELADDARLTALTSEELAQLRAGQPVGKELAGHGRESGTLHTFVPLPGKLPRPVALEIIESLAEEGDYIRVTIRNTIISTLVLLLACGLSAAMLGIYFIGRPAKALVEKARRVGNGDLDGPLALAQRDELGELAKEINAMCERLAEARNRAHGEAKARTGMLDQLRHADRLATVGRLAAGIAHELGTPLNVVSGRAQIIGLGELDAEGIKESSRIITEQTKRMAAIIRQLLDFARRGKPAKARQDLAPIAVQCVALLQPMAKKQDVTLAITSTESVVSLVDVGQLQQVLTNLIVNAIQASRGGKVSVELEQAEATPPADHGGEPGNYAVLRIRDSGVGMDEATIGRIFEPFFTTKDVGDGTGLGLSVAHGIVHDHEGWIAVESQVRAGSLFSVYLPLAREEASP